MQRYIYGVIFIGVLVVTVLFGVRLYTATSVVENDETTSDAFSIWTGGSVLSRVDYRFFACGEEYIVMPTADSEVGQGVGLYKRSTVGSMILEGTPKNVWDATLFAFFSAVGGELYFPTNHEGVMIRIPTDIGVVEFNNDHTQCSGKTAQLRVFEHHFLDSKDLDSLKESISWKYFDYLFQNNYGTVPPGDCLVFVFDTEEELEKNWPVCTAYVVQALFR